MIFLLKSIVLFSAASIIYNSIAALNAMSFKTNHILRIAHILMSCGALYEIFWLLNRHTPNTSESLFIVGCALLLIFDRRKVYQCPRYQK